MCVVDVMPRVTQRGSAIARNKQTYIYISQNSSASNILLYFEINKVNFIKNVSDNIHNDVVNSSLGKFNFHSCVHYKTDVSIKAKVV